MYSIERHEHGAYGTGHQADLVQQDFARNLPVLGQGACFLAYYADASGFVQELDAIFGFIDRLATLMMIRIVLWWMSVVESR